MYTHVDLVERAFVELFFCRVLRIGALGVLGVDEHWAYDKVAPFVSLPCVQNCELLFVGHTGVAKAELSSKLMRWLNEGDEKKRLVLESRWWPAPQYLQITVNRLFEVSAIFG